MNTAILISIILSATVASFTLLIIYKHMQDLQIWRAEALLACKRTRMRQELVRYVSAHRQLMPRGAGNV